MRQHIDFFDGPQRSQFHIVPVGAVAGGECHLVFTPSATFLYDSGFCFCAPQLVDNIRLALNGRTLDYILLTHSHYDHVLGSVLCKQTWPNATVVASDYAAKIFQKPTARAVMRDLDAFQAAQFHCTNKTDNIDSLQVDLPVTDGDLLQLGQEQVRIIGLPGHTRCSIGFYFPQRQILFGTETLGVPGDGDVIVPSYLVGYQMTLDSIAKAKALPMRELFVAHAGMLYGDDCTLFLEQAAHWCKVAKDAVLQAQQNGADLEGLIACFRQLFYPKHHPNLYPEKAFQTNVRVQIPLILRECAR